MPLAKTPNSHVMLNDVTGMFECFLYPYNSGAWSSTAVDTYGEAIAWVEANGKETPPCPTLPAAPPPPPPAAPVVGHKPPPPAPMPMAQAPALARVPLPVGAKAPPVAELLTTGHNRIMRSQTEDYCKFLAFGDPYQEGAVAEYMFNTYGEALTYVTENRNIIPQTPAKPADVLNLPFPAPKPVHERIHQGFDDYHDQGSECIAQLLDLIEGDHAEREGLADTPKRVVKAWKEWTSGYNIDIAALLKVFEDGAENYDEMVVVKDIPIYSKCEHHLADIFGTATIAYIPNGKVVGLSKISRVADAFARRLQVQERLTTQIADALVEHLQPLGVGVVIKARHMCMESRGICQQGHHTVTSALRGVIKDQSQTRAEFLALANS